MQIKLHNLFDDAKEEAKRQKVLFLWLGLKFTVKSV